MLMFWYSKEIICYQLAISHSHAQIEQTGQFGREFRSGRERDLSNLFSLIVSFEK